MRPLLPALLAALAVGAVPGCDRGAGGGAAVEAPSPGSVVALIRVDGMTCASCALAVRVAAERVDGVASAEVDLEGGRARVVLDPARARPEDVAAAIARAGYPASVIETREP